MTVQSFHMDFCHWIFMKTQTNIALAMKPEPLHPLPYHQQIARYFQSRYSAVWASFDAARRAEIRRSEVELKLLKTSFRLSETDHPGLYEAVARARSILGLEQPIILYQSNRAHQDNAAMFFTEKEGHLQFEGEILKVLRPEEIAAVIGHEAGHYKLWTLDDGRYHTTSRILDTIKAQGDLHPSLKESCRLFQLYTEIYCDRAGASVAGSAEPMVSALVRLAAGEVIVSAADYIAQAEEIFRRSGAECSHGDTHPERFIRARAVARWFGRDMARPEGELDRLIEQMIGGRKGLNEIDAVARDRLADWTRTILRHLDESVREVRTTGWQKHFDRFQPGDGNPPGEGSPTLEGIREGLAGESGTIRDYFVFLLMDFAAVDPSVEKFMTQCKETAVLLGLECRFDELVQRDLIALAA